VKAGGVEGSRGLGADRDRRWVEDEGIAEAEAEAGRAVAGDETQDCVREVGCEDWDQKR
jgi:hypothetical protein